MSPRVSVIMPAYNVEEWIGRSIASVLRQTETDFELIIVDDCSSDATVQIVADDLRGRPDVDRRRVRLVRQPVNGGYGRALATGLAQARGEWVSVHDADDSVDPTLLERLVACAVDQRAEIAMCRMRYTDSDGVVLGALPQWVPKSRRCSGAEALRRLARGHLNGFQANKLVHRSLWAEGPSGTDNIYADIAFTARLFSQAEQVGHCPEALYNYTQRSDSVTGSLRESIWDLDAVSRTVAEIIDSALDPAAARTAVLFFTYRQVYWPMLHKAAADPGSALATEVVDWVRDRIELGELFTLARHGDPGPTILATMALAKVAPRLHDHLYRLHKKGPL